MPITLDGTNGITTPDLESSGNVTANGLTTELRPLVLGTTVTASGTTVDFTGIPSWVKRVTIMLDQVSLNGADRLMFQLGTSSGIDSTNYAYSAVDTSNLNTTTGLTSGVAGGFLVDTDLASFIVTGMVTFATMGSNVWLASAVLGSPGYAGTFQMGGRKTLPSTLDRVRITSSAGSNNFDAGAINIMYE